jgi:hypothetical protein
MRPEKIRGNTTKRRRKNMRESTEKTVTKSYLLRTAFLEKPEWTMEELLERTGYDEANLKTSIGLMKNYDRTLEENLLNIVWDKERKVYLTEPMPTEEEWRTAKDLRRVARAKKAEQAEQDEQDEQDE